MKTDRSNQTAPRIAIRDFRMQFGAKTVIDGLSFTVKKGEVFGFLGSNGSGKTTTIRALLGLYEPTAGELLINGERFSPEKHGGTLGYLPEERGLYKKEPVIDVMVYFARLKGMEKAAAREWSLAYLDRVGLADKAKVRLDKLSGGQQQKVQLGITIMNDPDLLILDEPTKGFDPVNRRLLMDIIADQNARGATVVMVTHQMEEVERLCQRVILLKNGKAEAYGTIDEIKEDFGGVRVVLKFTGKLPAKSPLYGVVRSESNYAELEPKEGVSPQEVLQELAAVAGLAINSFEVRRPSLDEIFVTVYGDQNKEVADA